MGKFSGMLRVKVSRTCWPHNKEIARPKSHIYPHPQFDALTFRLEIIQVVWKGAEKERKRCTRSPQTFQVVQLEVRGSVRPQPLSTDDLAITHPRALYCPDFRLSPSTRTRLGAAHPRETRLRSCCWDRYVGCTARKKISNFSLPRILYRNARANNANPVILSA